MTKRLSALPATALSFCVLLFGGCIKASDSWLAEREEILNSINETYAAQAKNRKTIEAQERRILELENRNKAQAAEIEALKSGRPRASRSVKNASNKKTTSLIKKLDRLESSIQDTVSGTQQSPSEIEKNTYTSAYLAYKSNRYDEASSIFEGLLKSYPNGEYTDQTLYWLGESYLAQKKASAAIKPLEKLVSSYPESSKYASALLKLGTAYQSVGQRTNARKTFQRLLNDYPDSDAAEAARQKLRRLKK